ncbi:MAG: alpha/beta hydrolase [Candidatus Saccharibacteria bacterium]|nr:alpha/beta hydrolase [Candidatus Saccharibacteria bacterium]
MAKKNLDPADFIVPLNISGLEGRMLHIPPQGKGKREILFVYGHHSTLERWWGLMNVLSEYGTVTMPDLPGFGGMDSFYKVGQKPTIDAMADYMAAFIKWRYKRKKKVTLVGISFGFVVITRMLQRYPDLTAKVDLLISLVGFAHRDDFLFSPTRRRVYRTTAKILSYKLPAFIFRYTAITAPVLRLAYAKTYNAKKKFAAVTDREEFNRMMDFEVVLWHQNHVRTHWFTSHEFLDLDNCDRTVDLPVWHVATANDHFFDHSVVEQHMRVIFSDFEEAEMQLASHAPSVIADAEMAAPLVPEKIRRLLAKELKEVEKSK